MFLAPIFLLGRAPEIVNWDYKIEQTFDPGGLKTSAVKQKSAQKTTISGRTD